MKICNMCKKEFDYWDLNEAFAFDHHAGYGSKFDGERIHIDFCCECFDKVMEVIVPMCQVDPIVRSA